MKENAFIAMCTFGKIKKGLEFFMESWLNRTQNLIGKENIEKLAKCHVAVFGCGGVGSYAIEALARSGVGKLTLVDKDVVDVTNINRQLIADTTTLGKPKVLIEKERLLKINPQLEVFTFQEFFNQENADMFFNFANNTPFNYIIDAIDTVSSKISLIEEAKKRNIPIISCMGTGNKLDPTKFEVADISKTSVCPLAKVMRKELGKRGIKNVKVVYSKEIPYNIANIVENDIVKNNIMQNKEELENMKQKKRIPASISFVPPVAGFILAGEVIKDLIEH